VRRAFEPLHGMYATETRHAVESRRLVERALAILGEQTTWSEMTPGRVRVLPRILAQDSRNGEGLRTALYMCDMLYAVANWLRGEELISESTAVPSPRWKKRVKAEWQRITGKVIKPARPRHSEEEMARIFAALEEGDPRIQLLLELAAELRGGQAVRGKRSDLDLGPVGGFGCGRFTVHGFGTKMGEIVDLHPELRELVDRVLQSGYLADAEAAYQRGEIGDYHLFPAGRFRQGRALVSRAVAQPLGPKTIRSMFLAVEAAAGVAHVEKRSLYGLRRRAADLAPNHSSDGRVLDRLTGHVDSETREEIYQDRETDELRAKAAEVRRAMRGRLKDRQGRDAGAS
jgi:integrase